MDANTPNRVSDAGPERSPAITRQSLYSLLSDDLQDQGWTLNKLYLDSREQERTARLAQIDAMVETLKKLREVA